MLNRELPPVQGRCAHCPPLNRGTKISLALGIISLIGGVLATCFALQFLSASHWVFYTGCGVVALSFVAFSLSAICARFFGQTSQGQRPTYEINNNNIISITLSQHELRSHPELHLSYLATQIDRHVVNSAEAKVHIQFHGQNGIDVGGLTAIYFNDLISGITSKEHLFKKVEDSSYYLPNPEPKQDLRLFEQLGKAMMYCYPKLVIGDRFDHALFAIALSFSTDELDRSFDSLDAHRKVELYQTLLDNMSREPLGYDETVLDCLRKDVGDWSKEELQIAIDFVEAKELMPPNLLQDLQDLLDAEKNCNNQLIEQNKQLIEQNKQRIKDLLFTVANELYDPQIRGIHAIAKGMRSVCHKGVRNQNNNGAWVELRQNITPELFNKSLQGSIDRNFIIGKIVVIESNHENLQSVINQKVNWLKAWIGDKETPDSDIRAFLQFVSGSTCLPTNLPEENDKAKITVKWQDSESERSHYPRASTCFNVLYLSPQYHTVNKKGVVDGTQEGFIHCLKEAIALAGNLVLRDQPI